jgi:hypothetical protein
MMVKLLRELLMHWDWVKKILYNDYFDYFDYIMTILTI